MHIFNPTIQDFAQIILNTYGSFHSIKTFKNLETATKWYRQFPQIAKAVRVEFPDVNHSTKTSRNSGSKVEWIENFQEKNL